jgi:hypothetical protein
MAMRGCSRSRPQSPQPARSGTQIWRAARTPATHDAWTRTAKGHSAATEQAGRCATTAAANCKSPPAAHAPGGTGARAGLSPASWRSRTDLNVPCDSGWCGGNDYCERSDDPNDFDCGDSGSSGGAIHDSCIDCRGCSGIREAHQRAIADHDTMMAVDIREGGCFAQVGPELVCASPVDPTGERVRIRKLRTHLILKGTCA